MGGNKVIYKNKFSNDRSNYVLYSISERGMMALISSSLLSSPFVKCLLTCIFLFQIGLCSVSKQHLYQRNVLNSFISKEHRLIICNRATIHHTWCKVQT